MDSRLVFLRPLGLRLVLLSIMKTNTNAKKPLNQESKQVATFSDLSRVSTCRGTSMNPPRSSPSHKAWLWESFKGKTDGKREVSLKSSPGRRSKATYGKWCPEIESTIDLVNCDSLRCQDIQTTTTVSSRMLEGGFNPCFTHEEAQVCPEQKISKRTPGDESIETIQPNIQSMELLLKKGESRLREDLDDDIQEPIGSLDDPSLLYLDAEVDPNFVINYFRYQRLAQSCGVKRAAALSDIRLQSPVYPEVFELLQRKRGELPKLLQMTQFFNSEFELMGEFHSLWRVIVDLFRTIILYGYRIEEDDLRNRMVKVWLSWSYKTAALDSSKVLYNVTYTTSRWCKVVKYKLAAFAAYAKCDQGATIYPKSPLNVEDNPRIIIDRQFAHWFDSLPEDTTYDKIGRMSLIDSICRGVKKGSDRGSEDDCTVNQIETFDLFTTKKPLPIRVVLEPHREVYVKAHNAKYLTRAVPITLDRQRIDDEIIRTVAEVLTGCAPFEMKYNHSPSFSSSTNTSRQKGGHMAEIRHLGPFQREVESDITCDSTPVLLRDPLPVPYANETEERDPLCRRPLPSADPDLLGARQYGEVLAVKGLEFSQSGLGTDLDIDELCELCLSKDSVIRPVALKEALKVRGITTPDALESWLLTPLQKHLSSQLAQFDVFKVTSTPIKAEHLKMVLPRIRPGFKIISGDYDNATNMILVHNTRLCMEQICKTLGLSDLYTKLAVRSLCGNVLRLLVTKKDIATDTTFSTVLEDIQREAQPMGKVLSFVTLCILNFTVCRLAYELDTGKFCPINEFPGLINGDDVFFPIQKVETWVQCAAMVGLENSIGKTFVSEPPREVKARSRFFIEMNSRTFIIDCSNLNDLKYYEVPFINFGLMKGLIRSENTADSSMVSQVANAIAKMGACHHELTNCFDAIYSELDYLFKGYHQDILKNNLLRGIPFYVPKWLGGLGLNPGPDFTRTISEVHRKGASVIFSQYENFKKRPQSIVDAKTCMIDDLITKNMRQELKRQGAPEEVHHSKLEAPNGKIYDLEKENRIVYTKLVEEVWRTEWEEEFFVQHKNKKESESFKKLSEKIVARKLQHNSKLWTSAHAKALNDPYVVPLPYHKLWHRKFDSYWPVYYVDQSTRNDENIRLIQNTVESTMNWKSKELILPAEILDTIAHLVRLMQHQEDWKIMTECTTDLVGFAQPLRYLKTFTVRRHGITAVKEQIPYDDIIYRNPILNGSISYNEMIYREPPQKSLRMIERRDRITQKQRIYRRYYTM